MQTQQSETIERFLESTIQTGVRIREKIESGEYPHLKNERAQLLVGRAMKDITGRHVGQSSEALGGGTITKADIYEITVRDEDKSTDPLKNVRYYEVGKDGALGKRQLSKKTKLFLRMLRHIADLTNENLDLLVYEVFHEAFDEGRKEISSADIDPVNSLRDLLMEACSVLDDEFELTQFFKDTQLNWVRYDILSEEMEFSPAVHTDIYYMSIDGKFEYSEVPENSPVWPHIPLLKERMSDTHEFAVYRHRGSKEELLSILAEDALSEEDPLAQTIDEGYVDIPMRGEIWRTVSLVIAPEYPSGKPKPGFTVRFSYEGDEQGYNVGGSNRICWSFAGYLTPELCTNFIVNGQKIRPDDKDLIWNEERPDDDDMLASYNKHDLEEDLHIDPLMNLPQIVDY